MINDIQRQLMRHALGLGFKGSKVAYRNRYTSSPGTDGDREWQSLCEAGYAADVTAYPKGPQVYAGMRRYRVRTNGAIAVLGEGEKLDHEEQQDLLEFERRFVEEESKR